MAISQHCDPTNTCLYSMNPSDIILPMPHGYQAPQIPHGSILAPFLDDDLTTNGSQESKSSSDKEMQNHLYNHHQANDWNFYPVHVAVQNHLCYICKHLQAQIIDVGVMNILSTALQRPISWSTSKARLSGCWNSHPHPSPTKPTQTQHFPALLSLGPTGLPSEIIGDPPDPLAYLQKPVHPMSCPFRPTPLVRPPYNQADLPHITYWTKADYLRDYQNGCGYLKMTHNDDSGAVRFLKDEDGAIVSKDEQQKYHEYQHSLLYTLLKHGLAPSSWLKISRGTGIFSDSFMGLYYSQWSDHPRAPGSTTVKQESMESSNSISTSAAINTKHRQSLDAPVSIRLKKMKLKHTETTSAQPPYTEEIPASSTPPVNTCATVTNIDGSEPEQILKHNPKIVCAISDGNVSEPSMHTVIPVDLDPLQFFASISTSAIMNKSTLSPMQPTSTFPNSKQTGAPHVVNPDIDDALDKKKKHSTPDHNSIMRPGLSMTARNVCAIDWVKIHKGSKTGEFANYWEDLMSCKDPVFEVRYLTLS
ncbi:hypothetical protein EDB19DRAFT_1915769 [Suillus lakei]|nr:hypothetical protein EDB19DRAFT_1915769 [Suillus lakei]